VDAHILRAADPKSKDAHFHWNAGESCFSDAQSTWQGSGSQETGQRSRWDKGRLRWCECRRYYTTPWMARGRSTDSISITPAANIGFESNAIQITAGRGGGLVSWKEAFQYVAFGTKGPRRKDGFVDHAEMWNQGAACSRRGSNTSFPL